MKPQPVSSLLRALRDAEAAVETPPRVERAVLTAWDGAHSRQARSASFLFWQRSAAVAAAAVMAFTLTLLGGKLRTEVSLAVPGGSTMVFVGAPILQGEPVRVVRMRIPAATLSALGVRSVAGDAGDAVDVDVIVGEDGVARAIRIGM